MDSDVSELEPFRPDGTEFLSVRHDQLLLVLKNHLFDKRPYALFLSRANTSNVGVNSQMKKSRRDENTCTN